ncbi:tyrosine-type recombinase/integrase [Nocardia sp. NPDC057272]|uniref:tyrosine-type recombinase/integrase n=1 Tax=Nocardia sp. NPDC057272 TaxID=3346079 RepID=UPI0036406EF7
MNAQVQNAPGPAPWKTPAGWADALETFVSHLRARGASKATIRLRTRHIQRLSRTIGAAGPDDLTRDQLLAWAGEQDWQIETRRSYYQSIRAFYGVGVGMGYAAENVADVLPVVPMSAPDPRPTPIKVYRRALNIAVPRERLMLRLSAEAGMRRAEVAQAHSRDLVEDDDGYWIRVHGKGGKVRYVPLVDDLAEELRAAGHGYYFPGRNGGHLSAGYVGVLVTRLLEDGNTMHKLRHMFGTRTYRVHRDLFVVQELLGHANANTTRRYVKLRPEDLRSTVDGARYS